MMFIVHEREGIYTRVCRGRGGLGDWGEVPKEVRSRYAWGRGWRGKGPAMIL